MFTSSHVRTIQASISNVLIPFVVFLILTAVHHYNPSNYHRIIVRSQLPPSLQVITLLFGGGISEIDLNYVEHNCAMIKPTKHSYTIYTENTNHTFCQHCQCVKFVKRNCACPRPDKFDCSLCEKLHHLLDVINTRDQFVFMDSDLFIVKPQFLNRLAYRSLGHDFLALGGVANEEIVKDYYRPFNSGLFFMRKLKGIDYFQLLQLSWQMKANNDQNVLSRFIFLNYENWDRLTLKWHCRTTKAFYVAPLKECYTIHGRGNVKETLRTLNFSLKKLPAVE